MKNTFKILAVVIASLIIFQSNTPLPSNPRIGSFSLFREFTEKEITAYFGQSSVLKYNTRDDENGETCKTISYLYKESDKIYFEISLIQDRNRINGFEINIRDSKYAINGILMVGDPLSKVNELGYKVNSDSYTLSQNYVIVELPIYKKNNYDYCYYLEVHYDDNKIIQYITMSEDQGV